MRDRGPVLALVLGLLAGCGLLAAAAAPRAALAGQQGGADPSGRSGAEEPRLGSAPDQGQAAGTPVDPALVLQQASPAARAAWQRLLASSRPAQASSAGTDGSPPPPRAFHILANVITRDGEKTNQVDVDYRFLAPHFVRFLLPSHRETGRGSGQGNSAYWLKDKDDVQILATRDNKEDRRLVNEMIALARNFLALADPARIRLVRLEHLDGPPVPLPPVVVRELDRLARKGQAGEADQGRAADAPAEGDGPAVPAIEWLRVASPDFDLVPRDGEAREGQRAQLVTLALGPDHLPHVAVIRDPSALGRPLGPNATLVRLSAWTITDGYCTPRLIRVHRPEALPDGTWAFGPEPVQDIEVRSVDLRPGFVPTDFDPAP